MKTKISVITFFENRLTDNKKISKLEKYSNWENDLNSEQKKYAAIIAFILIEIFTKTID